MASFDIFDAARFGYRLTWDERAYLLRLALVPIFIKFICLMAVMVLGWEEHFLRQALLLLPAYFADGWMLAHFTRLVFLGQRWPFRSTGDKQEDAIQLLDRKQGILRGTLVFAVTRFLLSGLVYAAFSLTQEVEQAAAQNEAPPPQAAILAFAGLVFSVWGFRLLWLNIPASVSYPLRLFLRQMGGVMSSFYMIAVWLVCFLPVFAAAGIVASLFIDMMGGAQSGIPSLVSEIVVTIMRTVMDTAIAFISTAGMAWGLRAWIGAKLSRL